VTEVYGGVSSLAVDPIEKKPFFHVRPGSSALSLGTFGCTLACAFCQNAAISQTFQGHPWHPMTPEAIADQALRLGCPSVALTYNEPLVSAEWTLEVAQACHARGVHPLLVTSGFVTETPLRTLLEVLEAANVDLKAFSDSFYRRHCRGRLGPVLEALQILVQGGVWVEITTLLIPGENDSERDLRAQAAWIRDTLGPTVPLHFTAFHPSHRMLDRPSTPLVTLQRARQWAREEGLSFVYTGNRIDPAGQSTACPTCGALLVTRDRGHVQSWNLQGERCALCGQPIPGRWT